MNKMKKTSAALMAAAVLAVAAPMTGVMPEPLGVVASAAETKLVKGGLDAAIAKKFGDVEGINVKHINLGNGYYILQNDEMVEAFNPYYTIEKIVYIGNEEIAKWRATGKLEPTAVQCDVDVTGFEYITGGFANNGKYIMLAQHGVSEISSESRKYVLKVDENVPGKLVKAYDSISHDTFGGETGLSPDGYSIYDYGSWVITPTGEKIDAERINNQQQSHVFGDGTGKYIGYAETTDYETNLAKLYGIRKTDGKQEELCEVPDGLLQCGYGYAALPGTEHCYIYTSKDGKLHDLGTIDSESGLYVVELNDDVATLMFGWNGSRCLMNLDGKQLSKKYAYMETIDNGKMYLVQSEDTNQWGYIDSTGKEIAMFDDAGAFTDNGLYAPVVKDGKGWLIDKNMNQVSEKIDAVACVAYGAEFFRFVTEINDSTGETTNVFVTLGAAGGSSEPTKPSEPTVPTKQQSFHDDKTDISVDGKFPEGTVLKTEAKQNTETRVSWDITPVDANGNKVQPEGDATVKLPLAESFKGKTVYVYRNIDGRYTALQSTVLGDYITFKTNHFSEYVLTTEKVENKTETNPATGYSATAAVGFIALAGAFAIVSKKKR